MSTMTYPERHSLELEARGSALRAAGTLTALGITLIALQYQVEPRNGEAMATPVKQLMTPGSAASDLRQSVDERHVFAQLNRVYDHLLQVQTELDSEPRRVLYSNLWELYE